MYVRIPKNLNKTGSSPETIPGEEDLKVEIWWRNAPDSSHKVKGSEAVCYSAAECGNSELFPLQYLKMVGAFKHYQFLLGMYHIENEASSSRVQWLYLGIPVTCFEQQGRGLAFCKTWALNVDTLPLLFRSKILALVLSVKLGFHPWLLTSRRPALPSKKGDYPLIL